MWNEYLIDPDIRQAETLPGSFYHHPAVFERLRQKVFARSWQLVGDESLVPLSGYAHPFFFVDYFLEEPMLLVKDQEGILRCLSNVCTHRGNILATHPGRINRILCRYHGRRFNLKGTMEFMPEFEAARNFPRPCDHLSEFGLHDWGPFIFTALNPAYSLEPVLSELSARVGHLPLHSFRLAPEYSKDYLVHAHWALYCDNYLEGFHIPYIHQELNAVLDYGRYATHLYDHMVLQVGYSDDPGEVFDLPASHPDHGLGVSAYYFWIFPNLMFNFYPWGLSINIVKPLSVDRTRVTFLTYIHQEERYHQGIQALIDKVEREDELVVEQVHKGLRSQVYLRGRYAPEREKGVHHFHRYLGSYLQ